jgi:iron complex outermembrane receptor protein
VLVDGRQIYDSLFGGTLWGSWPFQLEDIERIEVVRGPGGVTWGANAVSGVVNIITKDPRDQEGLTFSAGGGSRGTHKEHLGYALVDGKLRLRVSGEYEASDGFRRGGTPLFNLEDDYKVGRIGLHAVYDATPRDQLTFSAGSGIVDGGAARTPLAGLGAARNPTSQASYLMGTWEHKVADDNWFELIGYVNDFHGSPGLRAGD